jgi:hypothetical protein
LRGDDFPRFCRVAFAWGRLKPCAIIVEEISWVTHPGKAPDGWLEIVTGALKYGIDIVTITQRPAESDKTALGNATIVRCFQLELESDEKYMARHLRVDVAKLPARPLDFIEKDKRTGALSEGRITF